MDRDQLIKRLMVTFLGELEEHVRSMNHDLLALEREPGGSDRGERYKTLFRTVHSLKGAARSVNVTAIEEACHRLEEILGGVREGAKSLTPELFALLFEAYDAIEAAGMQLREQADLTGSPLTALLPRLSAVAVGGLPPIALPPPATADLASPPSPQGPEVPEPSPAATAAVTPEPSATVEEAGGSPRDQGFVRIPAHKLDDLLTRSGELLVARRQVESWAEGLAKPREFLGRWKAEWRTALKPFARLLARDGDAREGLSPSRRGRLVVDDGTLSPRAVEVLRRVGDNLNRLEKELDRFADTMAKEGHQLDRAAALVDEEVRRVRMLPFADACQGLERTVRDVARAGGKRVELIIKGGEVELDRSVLEGLKDPLSHLVRNAVDHGLEAPEVRLRAGKAPEGRLTVSAALRGNEVEVIVADDGNGLDPEAIRRQARKRGIAEPKDEHELAQIIFYPGFSTAPIVSNISGRGVGLDVVSSRLESLHGTIDLKSEAGRGTRFILAVPLTLTTLRALLVSAGGQIFALASTNVQKLVRVGPDDFRSVQGREALALGGPLLPVASLAEALGLPPGDQAQVGGKRPGLVVAAGEKRMAFLVDELLAEQEVMVKGLGTWVRRVREFSGATILSSGRIALVLNAASLIRTAQQRPLGPSPARTPVGAAAKKRILVVDDSITTRTLEKSILEAAGYEVLTAVDGEAGWQLLQERGADLLLSDVQMPRMDGFALTEAVRASKRFADLPVVLFTSMADERDRAHGIEVGADAYIVKGAFDQKDLIETIAQLL